jgi:pyruvate/2-oxoglutarate/acetoin dehydrogenase E1 component
MSIRKLKYSLAINEALRQCMLEDKSVCVIGQGWPGMTEWEVLK